MAINKLITILSVFTIFSASNAAELPGGRPKIPRSKSEVRAAVPQPGPRPSCLVNVRNTIVVRENSTFDGKGCLYSWKGAGYPSKCNASSEISEREPPMFEMRPGAVLKNLQMECALDGIHTTRNNKIINIINRDVEEDAITIGENIEIRDSEFWFCQDKCLQMNRASGVKIINNKFYHAHSPIKANTGRNVTVANNFFYNNNRSVRSAGSVSNIRVEKNAVNRTGCYLSAEENSLIEDFGGNSLTNVENAYCKLSGGRVVKK